MALVAGSHMRLANTNEVGTEWLLSIPRLWLSNAPQT